MIILKKKKKFSALFLSKCVNLFLKSIHSISIYCLTMEDQRIRIFGGFRVIVSINIFFHALSPDKARRAYLQCFYVFSLCQMNVSNTFPSEQRNKNAFYSKLRKSRYVDFPLYGSIDLDLCSSTFVRYWHSCNEQHPLSRLGSPVLR